MDKFTLILCIAFTTFTFKVTGIQGQSQEKNKSSLDFVTSRVEDGQRLLKVAYQGILGLESSVEGLGRQGIFWREITDGKRLVMLLYGREDRLLTCDIRNNLDQVNGFVNDFLSGFGTPDEINPEILNKAISDTENQGNLSFVGRIGVDQGLGIIEDYGDLVDWKKSLKVCRKYYKRVKQSSMDVTSQENESEEEMDRAGKDRQKRETEKYNIYPGTKWCGYGTISDQYTDLGDFRDPDKCCRTHDRCPLTIGPLTRKYGYFNYSWNTLLHCDCDELFRTCLKFQNNLVANNVGRFFFNIIKNQCFVLKRREVCVKKSFWGRCTQYKKRFRAEVLDPLEY